MLLPGSLFPASSHGAALSRHSGLGLIAHSPSSTPRPIRAMRSRNRVFAGSLVYGRGYDAGIVPTEKCLRDLDGIERLPGTACLKRCLTHWRIPSCWSGSAFKTSGRTVGLDHSVWARTRSQKVVSIAPKRHISAAGLARIRAANRARWAKARAAKK